MERITFLAPYTSLEELHNMCCDLSERLTDAQNNPATTENVAALSASLAEHLDSYNAARAAFGLGAIAGAVTAPQHAG